MLATTRVAQEDSSVTATSWSTCLQVLACCLHRVHCKRSEHTWVCTPVYCWLNPSRRWTQVKGRCPNRITIKNIWQPAFKPLQRTSSRVWVCTYSTCGTGWTGSQCVRSPGLHLLSTPIYKARGEHRILSRRSCHFAMTDAVWPLQGFKRYCTLDASALLAHTSKSFASPVHSRGTSRSSPATAVALYVITVSLSVDLVPEIILNQVPG